MRRIGHGAEGHGPGLGSVDAVRSDVFVADDRVLPLQIGAGAPGTGGAGIGNPEPGSDQRPRRTLHQGGGHRLGEEFLAQLRGAASEP